MNVNIRRMRPDESGLLREFLYQAIYLPAGTEPPPRSVVDLPELRVYTENFGTRPGDFCLVAEVDGQVVGAAWSRIMEDYGHIDNDTPSLALSLLPDCRGQGIGTRLLNGLLALLQNQGYQRASLSVQIENPALRLYQRAGFEIAEPRGSEYLMVRDFTQPVQQEDINMEIRLAQSRDIDAWMALVEQVRDQFPGLETSKAMEEHRATVLDFIRQSSAICAAEAGQIVGALLFSRESSMLCFLAVDPSCRRQHIARKMVHFMLPLMEEGRDIIVTTYRKGDPNGAAARAFYKRLGFAEGRLTEEFGSPVQEFVLKRSGR